MIIQGMNTSFGVFFTPLLAEFGWTRATLSGAYSVGFLTMGVMSIVAGAASDRFSPRFMVTLGTVFFGVGQLLLSQIHAVWQMYLIFLITGTGASTPDVVLLSTIARWFTRKRGIMSGIAKMGTGAGMLIMPLLLTWLISSYGWRNTYIILGVLVFITLIPLCRFLRRDPAQVNQLPDGEKEIAAGTLAFDKVGLTFREAAHTKQLWIICSIWLAGLFCIQSMMVHIAPHAIALGFSKVNAASVLSVYGAVSIVGRFAMGYAGDRVSNVRMLSGCFLSLVVAIFVLQFAHDLWSLYIFASFWGLGQGGTIAALSPAMAELFGTRAHGTLLGIMFFAGTVGGAVGPSLAGYIFDVTRSYRLDFVILLIVASIGLLLTLALKPANSIANTRE